MRRIVLQCFFLLGFSFCTCLAVKAQTATFNKQVVVSAAIKVELTDGNSQPLAKGGLYRIKMATLNTGTKTGVEYLVWYDETQAIWQTHMVSAAGLTSNHPVLIIEDNIVKVGTNHTSSYPVRIFGEYYGADNVNTRPFLFGASYHWQRLASRLYYMDGAVGIGTSTPVEKLEVNGTIRAKEIKVESATWPDYVFQKGYPLPSLEELSAYIEVHGHLPEVPSAKEVEANGVSLGEMNKILLKKIEEMTLHMIELAKENKAIKQEIEQLKASK